MVDRVTKTMEKTQSPMLAVNTTRLLGKNILLTTFHKQVY